MFVKYSNEFNLGLRHLMYRHPWVSSFLGVSTNILILTTIILISWARFLQPDEDAELATNSTEAPVASSESQPPKDSSAAEKPESPSKVTSKDKLSSVDKPAEESTGEAKSEAAPVPKSSLTSRFTWFLIKLVVKVLWQSFKLFLVAAVAVVSYEAVMVGVDTNNPEILLEATKQDLVYLANFLTEKSLVLVELLRQKISGE
jgi:hypothetical protein